MELFDIYFTGKLVEGIDSGQAKQNFAQLFKTEPSQVEKLFNGKPQLLKRGCSKSEAIKYKTALHKAGLLVAFKAHQTPAAKPPSKDVQEAPATHTTKTEGSLTLAPAGSDVLRDSEKHVFIEANIDLSSIQLSSPFSQVEEPEKETPLAPDISHLSTAAVGEDLLVDKPEPASPPPMDLDQFTVAEPGADLKQLKEEKTLLNPDISHITVAAVGSDIIADKKEKVTPAAPNTDHLSLTTENNGND
jgi:hypothetical protein